MPACSGHKSEASSARATQPRFSARYASNWLRRSNGSANDSPPHTTVGAPNRDNRTSITASSMRREPQSAKKPLPAARATAAARPCAAPDRRPRRWMRIIASSGPTGKVVRAGESRQTRILQAEFAGGPMPVLSATSPTDLGVTRSWTSPDAFAREVANARIYERVHFRNSTEVGTAMGHRSGGLAVSTYRLPGE